MAEILSPTTLVQVELFEDRAAITRRVVLPEAPGRYELVIDGLSPLLREAGLSFPDAEAGTGSGHVPSSFDVLFDAVRPELPGPNRSWTRCCRPARGPLRARAAGFATAGPSWKWIISSR